VRLAWNASPEEDVALYAVYRAEEPVLHPDRHLAADHHAVYGSGRAVGRTYRYVVTALDRARKANEARAPTR
jgi:hypothetical protein